MVKNFIIKKGKKDSNFSIALLFFFFFVLYNPHTHSDTMLIIMIPIMLIGITAISVNMIMFFRWAISYAVFLDMEKHEIILNHSLFFRKKKISLKDIKEVDTLNGNIILFSSTPLSKWQRMVSKNKKSGDYTIRFAIIDAYERKQLIDLLSTLKSN